MDRVEDWRSALNELSNPISTKNPSPPLPLPNKSKNELKKKTEIIDLTISSSSDSSTSSEEEDSDVDSPNSVRIIQPKKPIPSTSSSSIFIQKKPPIAPIFRQQINQKQQQQQNQQQNQSTSNFNSQFKPPSNPYRSNNLPSSSNNNNVFVSKPEGFLSVKQRAMENMKLEAAKIGIPIGIPVNAPYKKPPRAPMISSPRPRSPIKKFDEVVLTQAEQEAALKELFAATVDINEADLVEEQPEGLKATLFPHQRAGLHWLRKREEGSLRGGILADLMGLGKTVQLIALMMANKPVKSPDNRYNRTTLIICPVALMEQWKAEILSKTEEGSLSVYIHHGPKRREEETYVYRRDVVITSYSTVVSEWTAAGDDSDGEDLIAKSKGKGKGKPKAGKGGVLFQGGDFTFHRIILDEAHTIKNRASKTQKACRALEGKYRWCLTGTPIQNSVDDLFSLFEFLGKGVVGPYYEVGVFKEKISMPMKQKKMEIAMGRLRPVLAAAMLRRNKSLLILPKKTIIEVTGPFLDEEEKIRYMEIEAKMQNKMDRLVKEGGVNSNYISVLSLLLRMRQACSHRLLTKLIQNQDEKVDSEVEDVTDNDESSSSTSKVKSSKVKGPVVKDDEEEEVIVVQEEEDDGLGGLTNALGGLKVIPSSTPTTKDKLLESTCGLCTSTCSKSSDIYCSNCKIDLKLYEKLEFSTKIRRAIRILMDIRKESSSRKTIIFSQFTSFFDILEPFLKKGGFKFCRYDGSMNVAKKEAALDKIRKDPEYTVILISIKAGAVGLNLTECSRVILMDLWWNPQIQEQAFDRAHRMGQKEEVIIYKISVDNTIEDRILVLQTTKAEIAAAALDGGAFANNQKLSTKELLYLFRGDKPLSNPNSTAKIGRIEGGGGSGSGVFRS